MGVTRELPGGLAVDPSDVFQVDPMAGTPFERGDIHRHHHVGALSQNQRTLSEVQPLPADLTERVGAPLGGRPGIGLGALTVLIAGSVSHSRPDVRILHRPERGDHGLTGDGIELAVEAHHALQRGREIEAPSLEAALLVLRRSFGVRGLSPPGHGIPK
ncbi:MAG TPA: hypothetical protein VFA08_07385, partial [Actinomycetota bacterium]|nr:hypothetical protein [Actinomycetota bacterium]